MALKVANGMKNWVEWERPYRLRDKAALAAFAAENEEEIGFWKFVQYKFSTQWQAVKQYANDKGVQILGDIPIYVSADSVDAWVGGKLFELDARAVLPVWQAARRMAFRPMDSFGETRFTAGSITGRRGISGGSPDWHMLPAV